MLKQLKYIYLGLKDKSKCVYYLQHRENGNYAVFVDNFNCENAIVPTYTIYFADEQSAKRFACFNMEYDKDRFNVFVKGKDIIIEPKTVKGILKIDCEYDEMISKKFVKMFREQYILKLDKCKQSNERKKDDFEVLMY